jgi:hypothetical protein
MYISRFPNFEGEFISGGVGERERGRLGDWENKNAVPKPKT